ncbi:MAG: FG-GAP repeat domain-containing protein [Terriglobales bacterium]
MTQKPGRSYLPISVSSIAILIAFFALALLAQTTRTDPRFQQPKFIRASEDSVHTIPALKLSQTSPSEDQSPSAKPGLFSSIRWYYSGGFWAQSVAVGDMNGDGRMDLIAGNHTGTIGVLLANGKNSRFDPVVTYDAGGIPSSVAVADINGDGKPDVL